MKIKKLLSLFSAAAISASCFAGMAVTASATTVEELPTISANYTYWFDNDITVTPPTEEGGKDKVTGPQMETLFGGYFITPTNNTYANNKGKNSDHLNCLRIKNVQDQLIFKVDAGCTVTFHTQSYNGRGLVVTNTPVDTAAADYDSAVESYTANNVQPAETPDWEYSATDAQTIYLSSYSGDFYIAGVTVSYPSIEKETYTVTYSKGDAEGTAPATTAVEEGSAVTLPSNRSLYVEGKTLTGWNDGSTTYALGDEVTVNDNITLTPVFTDNTVKLGDAETTVRFEFRTKEGSAPIAVQGANGHAILVAQATINGSEIDVKMDIDATSGKFNNTDRDDVAQVNSGTKLTVPSIKSAVIKPDTWYSTEYTVNGTTYKTETAESVTVDVDGSVTITAGDGTWWNGLTITYPKYIAPSADAKAEEVTVQSNVDGDGIHAKAFKFNAYHGTGEINSIKVSIGEKMQKKTGLSLAGDAVFGIILASDDESKISGITADSITITVE